MTDRILEKFLADRREVLTRAVMDDDWDAVKKYCRKYKVPMPTKESVFKAGVYKAVIGCTDIPKEVQDKAFVKCLELGFSPFTNDWGRKEE